MFKLEKAITEWRNQLRGAGIDSAEDLNELETHLRDQYDQFVRQGLDEKKAFVTSVKAVGEAGALVREYKKNAAPSSLAALCAGIMTGAYLITSGWTLFLPDITTLERVVGGYVILLSFCLVFAARLRPLLSFLSNAGFRKAAPLLFYLPIMAWGGIYSRLVLPSFYFSPTFLDAMMLWILVTFPLMLCAWNGLAAAVRAPATAK